MSIYNMPAYELIDHTADIGFRLKARDLKGLFVNSARVMFDLVARKKKGTSGAKIPAISIDIREDSFDELYMSWLRELISLSDCLDVIFTDFRLDVMDSFHIKGKISGHKRQAYHVVREIKAVTYHDLKIEQEGRGYKVEVIFDV